MSSQPPDAPDPPPETAVARRAAVPTPAAFQRRMLRAAVSRETVSAEKLSGQVSLLERRIIELAGRWFEPAARIAIFIIYFWFGFLKLIGLSPATPLASALTAHTIGMQYFDASFKALAVYECGLGILFLIPAMTRISVILLVIHMGIVSAPLIIVASVAWIHPLVPTLEGQYIIKNLAIIALAAGIMAQRRSPGDRRESTVRPQSALSAGRSARALLKDRGRNAPGGSSPTRPATSDTPSMSLHDYLNIPANIPDSQADRIIPPSPERT